METGNEILIVDDDLSNLKMLEKILSRAGYRVRAASNSHQALASIADKHPALILLDIKMPVIDGFEICRRLKASQVTRKIPVIFISGFEDAETKVDGFNAGAVDYLTKPYQAAEILARVKTHLHLRQLQSNLEQAYEEMEERVHQRTRELHQTNQALRISEERYRSLFENTPVAIFEEDFSAVKEQLEHLKHEGIDDIESYLSNHLDVVRHLRRIARTIDINKAAVDLHQAPDKHTLMENLSNCFTEETYRSFIKVLTAAWNEIHCVELETAIRTLNGEKRHINVQWSVHPNYEKTLSRVLVTLMDITIRKRSEQALQASKEQIEHSLKEKNILLQEIYHRTKNNMQVITSLLALQSAHIQDPVTLQIFRETRNRIQSMALVHKKLYQSRNLSQIDLKYYISDLANTLLKSYHASPEKISLTINADSVFLSIDTAVPCGLIINELLSNSLLHAFPGDRTGEIHIQLQQNANGEIRLQLTDNGIGIPDDINIKQAESLGLQLIVSLIEEQLQGQLELTRNNGSAFSIRFREPHQLNRLNIPQMSSV